MRVVGLILVSVITFGPSAPAETRGRGCQPEFGAPKPSPRSKGVRARRFAEAFAAFESERDSDRRLDALSEALIEYRRTARNLMMGARFVAHLTSAKDALYRHLFDPDPRVRWGAAYAVAALHNTSLPIEGASLLEQRSDAHEVKVKQELRSYLRSHHDVPFTYFDVGNVRPAVGGLAVDVCFEISDVLRVPFATGPFVTELPDWVGPKPTVIVTAADYLGRLGARDEFTGERSETLRIAGTLKIKVPLAVVQTRSPIFINVQLNGRSLAQKILTAADLKQ